MTGRASPGPPRSRVLLIDLDNCPKELAELPNELANFQNREGVDAERVLAALIRRGWVACDTEGIVTYPGIEQWTQPAEPPSQPPTSTCPLASAPRKPAKRTSLPLFD